jgi:seryl-tRNA synthetase
MIDIQILRNDIGIAKDKLLSRGFDLDVATFQALENVRKDLQVKKFYLKRNWYF